MSEFDPMEMLRVLQRHDVRFVVIGGFAAAAHGSPHVTFDLDVVPLESDENLARLAAALTDLEAAIYTSDAKAPLPFEPSPEQLRGNTVWNLATRAGMLDLVLAPAGLDGFADADRRARDVDVGGALSVRIASLDTVIRSKEAADRPKDRAVLDDLRELRELS